EQAAQVPTDTLSVSMAFITKGPRRASLPGEMMVFFGHR
ncbi:MAG: hypothetical protein ACI9DC_003684, partial [Gammaproteobacteria bacterium]